MSDRVRDFAAEGLRSVGHSHLQDLVLGDSVEEPGDSTLRVSPKHTTRRKVTAGPDDLARHQRIVGDGSTRSTDLHRAMPDADVEIPGNAVAYGLPKRV